MLHYLPGFGELAKFYGWRIVVLSKSACVFSEVPVRYRLSGAVRDDYEQWKQNAIELLIKLHPSAVITSAARPNIYSYAYALPPAEVLIAGYHAQWKKLTDQKIPVGVICDNPVFYPRDVPSCAVRNPENHAAACAMPRSEVMDNLEDPLCAAAQHEEGIFPLELNRYFCNAEICPVIIGNVFVYRDGDHLTATFARTLAPYLGQFTQRILQSTLPENTGAAAP